jgi:CheY-like chemotaxis protein
MPQRTGVDFFLEVAARWPGREQRIVLMTGSTLTDEHRRALSGRMPQVLTKPFSISAVAALLETAA